MNSRNDTQQSIAVLADGGWIVTWEADNFQGFVGRGIYQRRYDKDGHALSELDQRVHMATSGNQTSSDVVGLADGGWIVTWAAWNGDGTGYDIYQQHYTKDGRTVYLNDMLVNRITAQNQQIPKVEATADGGWVVSWEDYHTGARNFYEQRYLRSGSPATSEQVVMERDSSFYDMPGGGQLRLYKLNNASHTGWDIYLQRYDDHGSLIDQTPVRVNQSTSGTLLNERMTFLPNGGWVVSWDVYGVGSDVQVYQQAFDKNGLSIFSSDQPVTSYNDGSQGRFSQLTALADGSWVVTWVGKQEGTYSEVFQQRFEFNAAPKEVTLSSHTISENSPAHTYIGTVSAIDPNYGEHLTYELINDGGGRFRISGDQLQVANGALLDFEQAQSHQIKVRVKDQAGAEFDQELTIVVQDVDDPPPLDPDPSVVAPPNPPVVTPLNPPVVTLPDPPVETPQPSVTVTTAVSATLPEGSYNLVAGGSGNISLIGNALNNIIVGNKGKNTINGSAGADQVNGGLGNDNLTGGSGKDAFVFSTKLGTSKTDRTVNFDAIKDFSVKDDSLYLENAIFKKLGSGSPTKSKLLSSKFFALDKAKDKDDYVIYNKKTGVLSYDIDGSGAGQAIEFAQLKKGLAMTYKDFFVI